MGTHTHWNMTINNYDETDLALVQQGYPDHIRQLVYTLERGEEGTPHIQAFIKMRRDCRLTHMKKLFPRGSFKYLDSSEYRLNAQRYSQKLDATAESAAVIMNGDPLNTIEGVVRKVVEYMIEHYADIEELDVARMVSEREMVIEDYTLAKIFVSSTYKTMWKSFGHQIYECLFRRHEQMNVEISDTHTHTHTSEENNLAEGLNAFEDSKTDSGSETTSEITGEDCESDQDSESSETPRWNKSRRSSHSSSYVSGED